MEFDEMKLIWDSQNNEPLFAIDQEALHRRIRDKEKSVAKTLDFVDVVMIVLNLVVGILLITDTWLESGEPYEYVLPAVYLVFFGYAIYRRLTRRQTVAAFEETILGRLEKGIWQADYLIHQTSSMFFWYLLPTMVVVNVVLFLNGAFWMALGLTAVTLPLAYFGGRWEVRKFYLPKKRELESIREILIQTEDVLEA